MNKVSRREGKKQIKKVTKKETRKKQRNKDRKKESNKQRKKNEILPVCKPLRRILRISVPLEHSYQWT